MTTPRRVRRPCVGGIIGALLTGILVNPALGGVGITDYTNCRRQGRHLRTRHADDRAAEGGRATLLWSGIGSAILYKVVDLLVGLRPAKDEEREGLDPPITASALTTTETLAAASSGPKLRSGAAVTIGSAVAAQRQPTWRLWRQVAQSTQWMLAGATCCDFSMSSVRLQFLRQ